MGTVKMALRALEQIASHLFALSNVRFVLHYLHFGMAIAGIAGFVIANQ